MLLDKQQGSFFVTFHRAVPRGVYLRTSQVKCVFFWLRGQGTVTQIPLR